MNDGKDFSEELPEEDELAVLFTDDVELLEDRLTDIIHTMGLPEQQRKAALRLINVALEEHHTNILDTFESVLGTLGADEEIID